MNSGTGKGGKVFNDRELAARVRTLTMNQMEKVLNGKDEEYKKALILRLATTILPRINAFEGNPGDSYEVIIRQRNAETKDS